MGFVLNLTGEEIKAAQGGGFEPLPAGTYGAAVYDIKQEDSKSSGKPMYVINYKIIGPQGKGRRVRAWYSFQPKALFKLIELNKALGLPVPDKAGEFEIPDAEEYLSQEVNLQLIQEEYAAVATADDVANGVLNEDGEPAKEGDDIVKYRNVVKRVFAYDEDRWTSEAEEAEAREKSGLFL